MVANFYLFLDQNDLKQVKFATTANHFATAANHLLLQQIIFNSDIALLSYDLEKYSVNNML